MSDPAPIASARCGVYRTPTDIAGVQRELGRAGLAWSDVSVDRKFDKESMLRTLAAAVGAPMATFGANWDALADVLQDLSWSPVAGHVIHLRGGPIDARTDDWATLIEILRDSTSFWRSRGRPFVVFVDGMPELPAWK